MRRPMRDITILEGKVYAHQGWLQMLCGTVPAGHWRKAIQNTTEVAKKASRWLLMKRPRTLRAKT